MKQEESLDSFYAVTDQTEVEPDTGDRTFVFQTLMAPTTIFSFVSVSTQDEMCKSQVCSEGHSG